MARRWRYANELIRRRVPCRGGVLWLGARIGMPPVACGAGSPITYKNDITLIDEFQGTGGPAVPARSWKPGGGPRQAISRTTRPRARRIAIPSRSAKDRYRPDNGDRVDAAAGTDAASASYGARRRSAGPPAGGPRRRSGPSRCTRSVPSVPSVRHKSVIGSCEYHWSGTGSPESGDDRLPRSDPGSR
jgi:hypothetical protein